jgi:hypothetical protein
MKVLREKGINSYFGLRLIMLFKNLIDGYHTKHTETNIISDLQKGKS